MIAPNNPEHASAEVQRLANNLADGGSPYLRAIRDTAVGVFLDKQLLRPPTAVLSALEELALCREAATRSVALYAKARDLELTHPDEPKYSAMADKASALMTAHLNEVVEMIEKATRVASNVSKAYSYASLCEISRVMLTAIGDVIGDERPDLLAEINTRLRRDFAELKSIDLDNGKAQTFDEIRAMDLSLDMQ